MRNIKNKNPLKREIENINFSGRHIEHKAYYELTIHTEKYDFPIKVPNEVDLIRDYNANVCDVLILDFNMLLGDFVKHVYPYKDNLRVTVVNRVISKKTTIRYKLVLTEVDEDIKRGTYNATDLETLNKEETTRITAQCINETIAELRTKTIFGIHKGADVGTVMGIAIQEALNKTTLSGSIVSKGVKMTKPTNARVYNHLIIPDGTSLLDLPSYFQDNSYGVFNGGIGSYLQSDGVEELFHVFPLYRPKKEDKSERILKVIATMDKLGPNMNNTYTLDPDFLTIAVELGDRAQDLGDIRHTEEGIGMEGIEAETILRRPLEVTEALVKSSKEWIKRKMIHKVAKDKAYKTPSVGLNNNFYKERSVILKNDGKVINVQWNLSNVYYLTPGMFVELFTLDTDGKVVKYSGTLQGVHAVTSHDTDEERAALSIFLTNDDLGEK